MKNFVGKLETFNLALTTPLNILKKGKWQLRGWGEKKDSKEMVWLSCGEEILALGDLAHLCNQLTPE